MQIGDIVQFRISEYEYRPLLVVKIKDNFLSGYVFPAIGHRDDAWLSSLGFIVNNTLWYVTDIEEGDLIGQWREKQ